MSYVEFETNDTRAIHMDARYCSELYINGELIHKTTVDTEAIPKISRIVYNFKKGKTPILVGGTGLYIKCALYDYKLGETNNEINILSGAPLTSVSDFVKYTNAYANGTRIPTVVNKESHIGVIASPAPRIIPDKD